MSKWHACVVSGLPSGRLEESLYLFRETPSAISWGKDGPGSPSGPVIEVVQPLTLTQTPLGNAAVGSGMLSAPSAMFGDAGMGINAFLQPLLDLAVERGLHPARIENKDRIIEAQRAHIAALERVINRLLTPEASL